MSKISKNIRKYYSGSSLKTDQDIEKDLKRRIKKICKPCWELKYCPYGPLIESFPLPGITRNEAKEHIEYLKQLVKTGCFPDGSKLDKVRKKLFTKEIERFNINDYDEGPFNLEDEMSCRLYRAYMSNIFC